MSKDYNIKDIVEKYGVSRTTVSKWIKKGLPVKIKIDKVVRFDPEEVEKWFQENNKA